MRNDNDRKNSKNFQVSDSWN